MGKKQEEKKNTFDRLKNKIINLSILVIPNLKGKLQMETNALVYAIGGVLSQQQEDDS